MTALRRVVYGFVILAGAVTLRGQSGFDRLLQPEPQNWLMYSGAYSSHRYSTLDQIDRGNVKNLELKWVFQSQTVPNLQVTPYHVLNARHVVFSKAAIQALQEVLTK